MREWLAVVPSQPAAPPHEEIPKLKVSASVPLRLLTRVVGTEGMVTITSEGLVVHLSSEHAASWVRFTLRRLGYSCA